MSTLTNQEVIKQLTDKIRNARIHNDLTQLELAKRAGVNINTIKKFESGENSSLVTLVSILRVLRLVDEVLAALPEAQVSPLEAMRRKSRPRQRVRKSVTK